MTKQNDENGKGLNNHVEQPNLVLEAHLTAFGNFMKCLFLKNKDEGNPVSQKQFMERGLEWAAIQAEKLNNSEEQLPEEIPSIQFFLNMDEKESKFTIVAINEENEDKTFNFPVFVLALQNFYYNMAKQLGYEVTKEQIQQ